MDITSQFDELLRGRNAPPTKRTVTLDRIDGFLKEALRINSHITKLHQNLRSVRRAYLARGQIRRSHATKIDSQPSVLTDRDREAVDKDAKEMMRELNWSIEALDGAEKVRYETDIQALRKKYRSSLGTLGSWASGGMISSKTKEEMEEEARLSENRIHRDGVLWYLRQQLQLCGQTQKNMMEARLMREVELNRSLASQAANMADFAQFAPTKSTTTTTTRDDYHHLTDSYGNDQGLSEEQLQMFEEGNQDMMKYYESMHEKVQSAQKSLAEISDLQSTLIGHLSTQTEHIDQLVADSFSTTENVEGGNKQLKKATQRPSAARFTFYAASGLCTFLVLWDLII